MRRGADFWLFLISAGPCLAAHPCQSCHPKEVAAYASSAMAGSLRRAAQEPAGAFTASSGTTFTVRPDGNGVRQKLSREGETSDYPVAYVIGLGRHAAGYLIQIGDHLFQSPICYYTNRGAYDLAPGYERIPAPDFTRPVSEQCLLCHAGKPLHVAGTPNRYAAPVFAAEGISCDRCHGPVENHLRHPAPGSIVNPAKLAPAVRDSVCEQCHLAGVTRVLNPGKSFEDFHPGRPLEETFTIYTTAGRGFRVISHAEQLAQSRCAKESAGKLWCGTCHNPHPAAPASAATYNGRCQSCHAGPLSKAHPVATDCVSCHMTRRPASDGGHTVFTDHHITRRPEVDQPGAPSDDLVPWRAPAPALQARNLALAYVEAGVTNRSPAQLVRGYRMLTEVEKASPTDVAVLRAIGRALLLGKQPLEALRAFERVLALTPGNATSEEDVGVACLEAGQADKAVAHLEQALASDPLLLTAATALEQAYRTQGRPERADALANRIRRDMSPALRDPPVH
jgi:hypothetical protein